MDLRAKGLRNSSKNAKAGRAPVFRNTGPMAPLEHAGIGEVKISNDQLTAIAHLYQNSPSMQAARSILMGQLLSSGIVIRRGGVDVQLTESFAKHLEGVWIPFARDVIDAFLQFGFCSVSIETEDPPPFFGMKSTKRKHVGDDLSARTRLNLIPVVCEIGTYEVSFIYGGRGGYKRQYRVSSLSQKHGYGIDEGIGIFWKTPCDHNGNVNSPVATCFDAASFIAALQELALNAETVRARMQLVTQAVPKNIGSGALDASSLFFDTESRTIQRSDEAQENEDQASALDLMSKMCNVINKLQTTNPTTDATSSSSRNVISHVPPELPPRLFTVPEKQQIVPNLKGPESRSDLDALMRNCNDSICAAMGVPASVIFEGKFSSNSMSQLQLLNTTVGAIAITVNSVLTACYHACYSDHGDKNSSTTDEDELMLVTAPLSATSEIEALYTSQVIDVETALPAALHSLGCSANEITEALRRRLDREKELKDAQTKEVKAKAEEAEANAIEAKARADFASSDKNGADNNNNSDTNNTRPTKALTN